MKNSRLRQDLPISINDRVMLPFREGFIFTKFRENKVLAKSSNLQYVLWRFLMHPNMDPDKTAIIGSSLTRSHVCFHDRNKTEVHLNGYRRRKSRRHFQDKMFKRVF